jgi:hypothetical protein
VIDSEYVAMTAISPGGNYLAAVVLAGTARRV